MIGLGLSSRFFPVRWAFSTSADSLVTNSLIKPLNDYTLELNYDYVRRTLVNSRNKSIEQLIISYSIPRVELRSFIQTVRLKGAK